MVIQLTDGIVYSPGSSTSNTSEDYAVETSLILEPRNVTNNHSMAMLKHKLLFPGVSEDQDCLSLHQTWNE